MYQVIYITCFLTGEYTFEVNRGRVFCSRGLFNVGLSSSAVAIGLYD
jgi:hypothetical protein